MHKSSDLMITVQKLPYLTVFQQEIVRFYKPLWRHNLILWSQCRNRIASESKIWPSCDLNAKIARSYDLCAEIARSCDLWARKVRFYNFIEKMVFSDLNTEIVRYNQPKIWRSYDPSAKITLSYDVWARNRNISQTILRHHLIL